jgi:SAM-dependent methyltransferase
MRPIVFEVREPLPHDLDAMEAADAYNAWLVDRARQWLHGRVLDAGAGIGTHTSRLVALADEVVALEPDAELATLLRSRVPAATVVEGDLWSVEGPFDAIVCFNVLEHIPDDRAALARFRELLTPGGALCMIVPAHPRLFGPLDAAFGHERRYSTRELRTKLGDAGLEPVLVHHVNALGAVGWFIQGHVFRRDRLPRGDLKIYNRLVPLIRLADVVPFPIGLSLWAVAKTTGTASASATNA